MAGIDVGSLVLQLQAKIGDFERNLAKAQGISNKQFSAIERRARQADKNLDASFKNMAKRASVAFGAIGAAFGVRELSNMADQWSDLNSRLALATGGLNAGADAMERLGQVARRSYSSLETTVESFIANSTALKELGYNTQQQLDYTEALNNALVISGAKGDRAKSVMNALSKSMALGKLSGLNLNIVLEYGGRVAQALAESMGVTVNQLRELGAAGKITTREMFGITSQINKLNKELDSMPTTIQDGFTLIHNALLQYVGTADQASVISGTLAKGLTIIADNFDMVGDAAIVLAGLIATRLIGRSIVPLIAKAKDAGVALGGMMTALRSASSLAGVAAAFGGIGGIAIGAASVIGGALVLAMSHYQKQAAAAEAASAKIRDEWEKMGILAPQVEEGVEGVIDRLDNLTEAGRLRRVATLREELEKMTKIGTIFGIGDGQIVDILDDLGRYADAWGDANGKVAHNAQKLLNTVRMIHAAAKPARDELENLLNIEGVNRPIAELIVQAIRATDEIMALETHMQSLDESAYLENSKKSLEDIELDLRRLTQSFPDITRELERIFKAFREGTINAEEFKSSIMELPVVSARISQLAYDFDLAADAIGGAKEAMEEFTDKADDIRQMQAAMEDVSKEHYIQLKNIEEYSQKQDELNAKTAKQLELEREITNVAKNYEKDYGEGTAKFIPADKLNELAQNKIDADRRRSNEGKTPKAAKDNEFATLTKQMQERAAALREEAGIRAQLNPLVNDYGVAVNKAAYERQLWAAAAKAGLDERDGVAQAIKQIAEELAYADEGLQKIIETGDKFKAKLEEIKSVSQDVTRTFIDGMIAGKSATEALGDALKRLGNKLLDSGLNALFDGIFASIGGGGGSGLGGLFAGLFRADGGEVRNYPNGMIHGKGTSRSDSIPTMLSNGEFVVNAAATRKHRALLEQINAQGLQYRANGGFVGMENLTMPSIPTPHYLQGLKNKKERTSLRVDVTPSPLFDVKVSQISDDRISEAAPTIVNQAVKQSDSRFSRNFQDAHNRSII